MKYAMAVLSTHPPQIFSFFPLPEIQVLRNVTLCCQTNSPLNIMKDDSALTFKNLPVTLCTTKFNTEIFCILITLHLCVLYGS